MGNMEKPMTHRFEGTHILSEFYNIQANLTCHAIPELVEAVNSSCEKNHMVVLSSSNSIFENGGYTVFFLLKESHLSIHFYIEYQSAFIDIFTCGDANAMGILKDIEAFYVPQQIETREIHRGRPSYA